MQGSKYSPKSTTDYGAKDLNANFMGRLFLVPKTTVFNADLEITDDHLVDGGRIIATNVVLGDKITCQVVDVNNIFGMGAGVVLNQFITDWYLTPGLTLQWDFTMPYPAKLIGGLTVRIIYTSVGTVNDVDLAINYKLHKALW